MPFDVDSEWPKDLANAVTEYRKVWRAKMDEVNARIEAHAEPERMVDQPEVVRGILRVSGPFTVEAVQPAETSLGLIEEKPQEPEFGGAPTDLGDKFTLAQVDFAVQNVQAYLAQMIQLLKTDGVRFPKNRQMQFTRLEPLGDASGLHAEGRWVDKGGTDPDPEGRATVVVSFGPQYGPVTAPQVAEVVRAANRRGYDNLVIAGFSFDGAAQTDIEESQHPKLHIDMAHIRPDVNPGMKGLLKEQPNSQLFSVFGQPRSHVTKLKDGAFTVTMEGVDIYDPVTNTLEQSGATKVAAWFIDGDYDGATFCITQAFFPNRDAWEKIARALKTSDAIDENVFEKLAGTTSLPFPAGKHQRVAVKVIDPRGNEVMQVHRLE
jgi:adenine-specific DNA-methyltransferase